MRTANELNASSNWVSCVQIRVPSPPVSESLVRRLAVAVVEALKAHGHILVVKGGGEALVRELSQLMMEPVVMVAPRLGPRVPLFGEVTSTFGHEDSDEIVEEMVKSVTHALMESDHVDDVFAEDNVIRQIGRRRVGKECLRLCRSRWSPYH